MGRLAELAGWQERQVAAPDLTALVESLDPELRQAVKAPGIRVAIGQVVVTAAGQALGPDEEVAFLPVYSGG